MAVKILYYESTIHLICHDSGSENRSKKCHCRLSCQRKRSLIRQDSTLYGGVGVIEKLARKRRASSSRRTENVITGQVSINRWIAEIDGRDGAEFGGDQVHADMHTCGWVSVSVCARARLKLRLLEFDHYRRSFVSTVIITLVLVGHHNCEMHHRVSWPWYVNAMRFTPPEIGIQAFSGPHDFASVKNFKHVSHFCVVCIQPASWTKKREKKKPNQTFLQSSYMKNKISAAA
jgi:hypothetical protein